MHEFVSMNRRIIPAAEARIPALSAAVLYGNGVFTTVAILDGKPFLWQKHWSRLMQNASKLGLDPSELLDAVDALHSLINTNGVKNGRARLTFFDESPGPLWNFELKERIRLLITTADLRPATTTLRLTVSPYRSNSASPLTGVKSCNYLEHLMAFDEAKSRSFDEAIRVNERREITSACMANVFWSKGEKLFTSSLDTGCLAGTTREFVLENAECEEINEGIDALKSADQIFLTSAGLGIAAVAEFAGRPLSMARHPIADLWPRY